MFLNESLTRLCLTIVLACLSCLLPAVSIAQSPRLEAALCNQANLVTGEYTPVSSLDAGTKGFISPLALENKMAA